MAAIKNNDGIDDKDFYLISFLAMISLAFE